MPVQAQYSTSPPVSIVGLSGTRDVPLNVKIVFLGLSSSDINSTYLTSAINLQSVKPQSILAGAVNTGVIYRFSYDISYANNTTVNGFATFLNGIGKSETTATGPSSPNPYFDNSTTEIGSVVNTYYNASAVEEWFASPQALGTFGPSPVPGYTIFIADLHNSISSFTYSQYQLYNTKCSAPCLTQATVHYYNRTVIDQDLELRQTRHFMTGWGGNHRFYYLDLSAGPSYYTGELPIQVASQAVGVNPASPYATYWRTTFITDYITGVVYNLVAPDPVYPVNYSDNYNFHVFVIDARNSAEKAQVSITSTVDETLVSTELKKLIPFSNVTVTTRYANISQYSGLEAVVNLATSTIKDPAFNGSIVDARLVYNWLSTNGEGHITQLINLTAPTSLQWDIPAFIFAFTGNYNFGFTFKDQVIQRNEPGSIYGVALGDLVLISHGQNDFRAGSYPAPSNPAQPGKGLGFSRTIIHELGHMVGLPHPFSYDLTEDFTDSVMGYYAESHTYSQFDRDMLLRGINDQLLIFAEVTLTNTTRNLLNGAQISAARQAITIANQKYGRMQYEEAVSDSYNAAINAFMAHQLATAGPFGFLSSVLVYVLIGLVAGIAVGVLVGFLVFRKRPVSGIQYYRCPTCQQSLRWDTVMNRWYCDHCQKPI